MSIWVCPLSQVASVVSTWAPERIVSLLDPDSPSPYLGLDYVGRQLRLNFHDVDVATWEENLPTSEDVRELLAFVGAWQRSAPLLFHCHAGVGRSPAAAFVAACALNPRASEMTIALTLRRAAPFAHPNQALVRLADAALSRQGRMWRAIDETRGTKVRATRTEGVPFQLSSTFAPESG